MHTISTEDAARLTATAANGTSSFGPKGRIGSADNAAFLVDLHEQWRINPDSVDHTWGSFFEGFELGLQQAPPPAAASSTRTPANAHDVAESTYRLKQARLYNLLFAYRSLGHQVASLDPLELAKPIDTPLDIHHFNLEESDLETVFDSGKLSGGGHRTLREIITILKQTYCGNIGVEYMHMQNFEQRRWLRDRMETCRNQDSFSPRKKRRILNRILAAEMFERFLHTRYVGQKRFGLEGGETLIPMLDALIEGSPSRGIRQIVLGMAHRGRLNVLTNILGMSYRDLFNKFAENFIPETVLGDGDVKYHLGCDTQILTTEGQEVGVTLAPNPSHLEAVNPVVEGKARAWQRILNDTEKREKVVPVLIHGDAAMIGQGIVQETLNLSQLEGYRTGGTLHIAINNQIGFTTVPQDARSTIYCTSVAKMLGVPIFHVNGDDPLAAVYILELALDFRQTFHRDVFIDLYCYRRHGHNEGDEPNFTQPTLYSEIDTHPRVSEQLIPRLVKDGSITHETSKGYADKLEQALEAALNESRIAITKFQPRIKLPLATPALLNPVETRIPAENLQRMGNALTSIPEKHQINKKLIRWLDQRKKMLAGEEAIDWGLAEALAFASILNQGIPIRLSGQDSRRGTFSHRHSVLYDVNTRERYIPLKNISAQQATFCVYNSPLSEAAVLGFDFGYSLDFPQMLCIWEAQFGDFANGAQVIIDQYISSCESKWGVYSGIVLLLPHGYQGQGPEHSSARLERFLQLCAEDNIQVANCTTPANFFHLLRRQAIREIKKPLVVMTPKSLLRDKRCTSSLEDFSSQNFLEIIADPEHTGATRLVLCSGKVYYDLADYRETQKRHDTALVRMEQLYPIHEPQLRDLLASMPNLKEIIWCQEESQNNGAWSFLEPHLRRISGQTIRYAGRDASASPATGALAIHQLEQDDLVGQAFNS
ncbi:MAG: 2-oxoglutarate dehydrogenase E1 component [Candidatus Methylacidiphilales bacterium]